MHKAYRIPLIISEEQIAILKSQSKICAHLYNKLLSMVKDELNYYRENQKNQVFNPFSKFQLRNQVPKLKQEFPFYKTIYSSVAKNVSFRLSQALDFWLEGKKNGIYIGFPKHRSEKHDIFFSLKYEDPFVGYKINQQSLQLSLGSSIENGKKKQIRLNLKLRQKLKFTTGQIKTLEITSDKGEYFAVFTIELEKEIKKKPIQKIIALDPNHKNLAVGLDQSGRAIEFQNLYFVKIIDKRIDQLKSKRDICKKYSRRWNYLNNIILQLYTIRRKQIQVGLRTYANYLCKHYDLIGIGDYIPWKQEYKKKNKAMLNQTSLGEFRSTLHRTCQRSGKTYQRIDEKNTTRTCSYCGFLGEKLSPEIRKWTCQQCNTFHVRDENAANNIMNKMLPGSGYLEIQSRYTCKFRDKRLSLQEQEIKSVKENNRSKSS